MNTLHEIEDPSRRHFLTAATTVAGAAALSALGLSAAEEKMVPNEASVDLGSLTRSNIETDVLVIGSGIAGLFAAVKAHDAGAKVTMVSKGRLGSSGQTPFARGIFAFDSKKSRMDIDEFADTVSRSALRTNNPVFTRQTAKHSLARVNELRRWGFFESPLFHKSFSRPLEQRNIPVIERVMLTHLIKDKERITGAAGFSLDEEKIIYISAKSIILCTGAGGFKPSGFPICDLTHDGTMMAYRIGAKVTGKEWNDGHPGNLNHPAAVYKQWGGMLKEAPKVTGVGIRHDLGVDMNYDIYKQGPDHEESDRPFFTSEAVEGGPYRPEGFDNPGGPPDNGGQGHDSPPPGVHKKEHPRPPGMGGVPSGGASAGMSIHKAEGLVPLDETCRSNIPGLYAAGDALGSYMAGAIYTQIGSSMAGSAVQGAIAGEAAAIEVRGLSLPVLDKSKKSVIENEILSPLQRKRGYSPAWVTQTLQSVMIPNFILYVKKERLLDAALAYVEELRDHHQSMLIASDLHELRLAHETTNMILNAEMKLQASIMRKESRCSHYRLDYPNVDDKNWACWINIHRGDDGKMVLEKQPFTRWPA